jgi:methionyl-tRNA formyltransferase
MRVVFMGTPDFSVPCLVALVEAGHTVPLVVTQPDRPKGRGRELKPTPVKQAALDRGIPVFQPERPNRDDAVATIEAARPEVLVVVAYGAILKARLLGLAPKGAVNVHAKPVAAPPRDEPDPPGHSRWG